MGKLAREEKMCAITVARFPVGHQFIYQKNIMERFEDFNTNVPSKCMPTLMVVIYENN
jgi:hypothetical protein